MGARLATRDASGPPRSASCLGQPCVVPCGREMPIRPALRTPCPTPRLPNGGTPARADQRRRLNLRAMSGSHRRRDERVPRTPEPFSPHVAGAQGGLPTKYGPMLTHRRLRDLDSWAVSQSSVRSTDFPTLNAGTPRRPPEVRRAPQCSKVLKAGSIARWCCRCSPRCPAGFLASSSIRDRRGSVRTPG
jgi:hypothetical protein